MSSGLILPARFTQQPQYRPEVNWQNDLNKGLAFAYIPSAGVINLANGDRPLQQSAAFGFEGGSSGISSLGTTQYAEFDPNGLDTAGNSLTILSIWLSKDAGYMLADGKQTLLGTRTAGNGGWTWGRNAAVAGGALGALTQQMYTLQAVAEYIETNSIIASRQETPIVFRANGTVASWFAFGRRSSVDTTIATSVAGGNLLLQAHGPYSTPTRQWTERSFIDLVWRRALSDTEIYQVSNNVADVWKLFRARARKLWIIAGPTIFALACAEAASAADTLSAALVSAVAQAESSSAAEAAISALRLAAAQAETAAAADAAAAAAALPAAKTETASAADAQTAATNDAIGVAEAASAADAPAAGMSSAAAIAEAGSAADAPATVALFSAAQAEAASAADAPSGGLAVAVAAAEAGSAAAAQAGAVQVPSAQAETAAAADTSLAGMSAAVGVAEAGTAVESSSTSSVLTLSAIEAAGASDAPAGAVVEASGIAEAASAADHQSAVAGIGANASEAGNAVDTPANFAQFSAGAQEVAAALDHQHGANAAENVPGAIITTFTMSAGLVLINTSTRNQTLSYGTEGEMTLEIRQFGTVLVGSQAKASLVK